MHVVCVRRVSEGDHTTFTALRVQSIVVLILFMGVLFAHSQQVESTARLDFLWKVQVSVIPQFTGKSLNKHTALSDPFS